MSAQADLFNEEPEIEEREPGRDNRCTPERLLEFCKKTKKTHRRLPTLAECKAEFGGVLGAMLDFQRLKKGGLI